MPLLQGESDCEGEVTPVLSPATRWMRSLFSTIVGWIKGILEFCFIKFYENIVDRAEWDSLVVSWFSWVATKGPLRKPLLDFFATSGNFIHRLTDVRANSKFATPASGPNEPDHLESSLGDVVTSIRDKWGVLYVYCWHGLCGYWGGISMEVGPFSPSLFSHHPPLQDADLRPVGERSHRRYCGRWCCAWMPMAFVWGLLCSLRACRISLWISSTPTPRPGCWRWSRPWVGGQLPWRGWVWQRTRHSSTR
mmetsp:Transcript_5156/g.14432  ORF Transcript_5156/g.14432 Transcript_5156/m.14432 type:complete len:250 (-) Transcript_5156:16-765(-)